MIINGFGGGTQGSLTDDSSWVTLASLTFNNQACTNSESVYLYDTNNPYGYDFRKYKYIRCTVSNYSFTGTHRGSSSSKSYRCNILAWMVGMSNWSYNYLFQDSYSTGYSASQAAFTTHTNYSTWEYFFIAHCQKLYSSSYGGYYYQFVVPPQSTTTGASGGVLYYYPNRTDGTNSACFAAGYDYSDSDGYYVTGTAYLSGTFTLQAHA